MMGNEASINLSLKSVWQSWFSFRKGKNPTREIDEFQSNLESSLIKLQRDLNRGNYRHGIYRTFMVCDNKKRIISVAPIRDRVVHRLLYDYLVPIYDKTFIFDAWSCREGKGLLGAIKRAQEFLKRYPAGVIWKADIQKFFDSVDHETLLTILSRRIRNPKAFRIIQKVIASFQIIERERESL